MDIRSLLKVMVDQEASDLYLTVDAPPIYRIHGSTQQTDAPPFSNEQLEALALALMRGQQRGEFEEKMEMNLALYYKELGRFRVNIFRQKGNVGSCSASSRRKSSPSISCSCRRSSKTSP